MPLHVGVRVYRRWRSLQELVVESLVVSLTLVMLDVLVDDEAHMPLAERDDTMEAPFFDRPDEPLGRGVEIRTLRRQPDWPNIATCQDLAKDPYSAQFPTRYFVLYFGCTLDFTSRS